MRVDVCDLAEPTETLADTATIQLMGPMVAAMLLGLVAGLIAGRLDPNAEHVPAIVGFAVLGPIGLIAMIQFLGDNPCTGRPIDAGSMPVCRQWTATEIFFSFAPFFIFGAGMLLTYELFRKARRQLARTGNVRLPTRCF